MLIKHQLKINGVQVATDFECSLEEMAAYVLYAKEQNPRITSIEVVECPNDKVDIYWTARNEKFERIRRITGYLVGTTDRWNDAKQAEERDRVKHS